MNCESLANRRKFHLAADRFLQKNNKTIGEKDMLRNESAIDFGGFLCYNYSEAKLPNKKRRKGVRKEVMKRFLSLLMCLTMLFGLVSCNLFSGTEDGTGSEESTDAVERIKLVENGKAVYTVVYPNDADPAVLSAMRAFINKVKEVTGVTLPDKSDYVRFGQTRDPEAKEILFGRTSYDETQEILSGLYADEYVMKAVGNKIVIVSTKDSNLLTAVNYFGENLVKENLEGDEGNRTLYFEEYHFLAEGADKILNIGGKSIQDYTIIYENEREGYKEVATRLRDSIAKFTGCSLPVVADTLRAEGSCEILIGNTNRKLSGKCYKNFVDWMTYKVVVEEDQLQLVSGGPFSARACVDEMSIMFFGTPGKQIKDGTYLEKDLRSDEVASLSAGADVRIMTANVLTSWWGEDADSSVPPAVQRAEIMATVLMLYKPDVVGLQEAQLPLKEAMAPYLEILSEKYGLEYSMLHTSYGGKQNLTSVLYRSDVLTVKDNGMYVYSYWSGGYHMRNITWAVFQKGTEQFMVANTHWAWETSEKANLSAEEHTDFINEMRSKYSCPIFSTGDYNAKHGHGHLNYFLENASVQCLQLQAKESDVLANECGGCNDVGTPRVGGNYIDHIIGGGNYTVLRYETVTGSMVHWLSDHSPHFADVVIN